MRRRGEGEMTLLQMYLLFVKIGAFTFGGGYAMIPLFQTELVNNYHFMTNAQFANFVALAQVTPGPVGLNAATYVGYQCGVQNIGGMFGGAIGGVVGTLGVMTPSLILVTLIAYFIQVFKENAIVKAVLSGGGTAGHINPALAIAGALKQADPTAEIHFAGRREGMEYGLVTKAGYPFHHIEINGFQRKLTLKNIGRNFMALWHLAISGPRCAAILKEVKPDLVIGCGGYVSGPIVRAAAKKGIHTAIHEQNAFPGITNKTLAKKADAVLVTVEDAVSRLESKNPPVITGLPVRGELLNADRDFARAQLGIDNRPLVLSFGGSLDAEPINEAMYAILLNSAESGKYHHIHSVGTNGGGYLEKFEKAGFKNGRKGTVEVRQYIDNMDICMAAADLVISRAGASTLSEIEALGKASVLIPSPYVAENHQYHNAMALVKRNAARIIEENELTAERLQSVMDEVLSNKEELAEIGKNAKKMAVTDSAERIAQIIVSLCRK